MRRHISRLTTSIFAIATLLASCSEIIDNDENDHNWESKPIKLTKAQLEISDDINTFGFKTFSKLCETAKEGDIVFSPLSLSLDLSMCALGAAGSTAEQMSAILGFEGRTPDDVAAYYEKVAGGLERVDNKTTFTSANSLWIDKDLSLKSSFVKQAEKCFNAESFSVDFSSSSTADKINSWVRRKTNNLVPKLLDQTDPQTVLSLLNALYFKGKWAIDFDKTFEKRTFYGASGESQTEFMTVTDQLTYADDYLYQMCAFPYGNGSYSLVVVLPKANVSLQKVADCFASGTKNLFLGAGKRKVAAKLPKFKIEFIADNLADILQEMGMVIPFTGSADFSNMSDSPLCISFVLQKAYIDVNEKGTEAAAVTEIDMKFTSAGPDVDSPVPFIADRPFLFFIHESGSNMVLFAGRKM